ncbi:MAG: rhodanese-like domain-containing protein [Candidatus Microthrix subdominans]|jgi:glyoxylase-like metal-dependent hydrolase (beta-lactamase superfamily II)/rhodanese-related sulfurtransferase|nr:MBL fold metallo-hydrolase [Candidatus Microthrix sp.]MBK9558971.1 MBL fold metallo-hydrolase [Candidatus Microthrix sp.]
MLFTQYYLDCLSHASYMVADTDAGVAAVVDPRRDIEEYLADAKEAGVEIKYVIETHVHADFLSGHLEMAAATGAEIIYGEAADTEFAIRKVTDGERISLGEVTLEFRATPGHTPESISVVVYEHSDDETPYGVLTGDTLFIGDVGRPDLLSSIGVTAEELGGQLYDSLRNKIMPLPDETRVFPAHGAGSACGKNLSTETSSTLGEQRQSNYALAPMSKERFVELVTEGQPAAPKYFFFDAVANRSDRELLDTDPPAQLNLEQVLEAQRNGAAVLDVRDALDFAQGHLAGSLNVGLEGRYAEFAGIAVPHDADIVLITEPGQGAEAQLRLGRIGFDNVIGVLEGPEAAFVTQPEVTARCSRLTAAAFDEARIASDDVQVIDVRNPGEIALGSIPGALEIPLAQMQDRLDEIDLDRPIVVHCAGGYRSSLGASWLRSQGATDVSDLLGGYDAWVALHAPA